MPSLGFFTFHMFQGFSWMGQIRLANDPCRVSGKWCLGGPQVRRGVWIYRLLHLRSRLGQGHLPNHHHQFTVTLLPFFLPFQAKGNASKCWGGIYVLWKITCVVRLNPLLTMGPNDKKRCELKPIYRFWPYLTRLTSHWDKVTSQITRV